MGAHTHMHTHTLPHTHTHSAEWWRINVLHGIILKIKDRRVKHGFTAAIRFYSDNFLNFIAAL